VLEVKVPDRHTPAVQAGIVDEAAQRAHLHFDLGKGSDDGRLVRHVSLDAHRRLADGGALSANGLGTDPVGTVKQRRRVARGRRMPRDRSAYAPAAAGDDDDAVHDRPALK
jgi:hypothetical protein